MTKKISRYEQVLGLANQLTQLGFMATVSHAAHAAEVATPWTITIGEKDWQRHLRVLDFEEDYSNARFEVLPSGQDHILTFDDCKRETTVTLRQLLDPDMHALKRANAKQLLHPRQVANAA
jgi:hypothetical protein